jgi:hypothetical protein
VRRQARRRPQREWEPKELAQEQKESEQVRVQTQMQMQMQVRRWAGDSQEMT